jgi:hypothetical protein
MDAHVVSSVDEEISGSEDAAEFEQFSLDRSCYLQRWQAECWPASDSEDNKLGALMELKEGHGEANVYMGVSRD